MNSELFADASTLKMANQALNVNDVITFDNVTISLNVGFPETEAGDRAYDDFIKLYGGMSLVEFASNTEAQKFLRKNKGYTYPMFNFGATACGLHTLLKSETGNTLLGDYYSQKGKKGGTYANFIATLKKGFPNGVRVTEMHTYTDRKMTRKSVTFEKI